jgi:sulfatase maturation enzyme AslB (radical SAM superfamily)
MASLPAPDFPQSPLLALDTVWFQVAGTLCNLQCTHCFISCSPTNHRHEMMTLEQVRSYLAEARTLGAREYYFTGGEPFLHRDLLAMIEAALAQGPTSILTNGVLIREETARALRALADASEYSLDLRVSLDGWDAATNDSIRGAGTFERILAGVRHLAQEGLNPVITVTAACTGADTASGRSQLLAFLREAGLRQPRLKVLPVLRLGAEASRTRPYGLGETLRGWALTPSEAAALQCSSARMVTAGGVYVCPILLDFPGARMANTLSESLRPFTLRYPACFTCHQEGLTCRT